MNAFLGFLHVRSAYIVLVFLATTCVLVVAFPLLSFGVSIKHDLMTRTVAITELVALFLAAALPVLTRPHFSGREQYAPRWQRFYHALYTLIVMLSPVVPFLVWYWRVLHSPEGYQLPSPLGFLGTPLFLGAVGVLGALWLPNFWGALVPVAVYALIVVTQHLYPIGITAHLFSTAKAWHSPWLLVTIFMVVAVITAFHRGSARG